MAGAFDVSTDDLRLLLAVARTGRMVAAGALLGVDHTTVRRRIRRLETSLGVTLLGHGSDGWELTVLGRAIAERAAPIEHLVQQVTDLAKGRGDGLVGSVRVGAPDGFGVSFVTPALAELVHESPGISVELVTSTRPLSSRGAGLDMAITIGPPRPGWLATELLTPYELGLYASRHYIDSRTPIARINDLTEHRLVFYVDSLLSVAELDLTRSFAGMRVGLGCTSVAAQVTATLHGAGIGLLPCFLAEPEPELVRVLAGEVRFSLDFSLSIRRDSVSLPVVALVREALRRQIDERRHQLVPTQ